MSHLVAPLPADYDPSRDIFFCVRDGNIMPEPIAFKKADNIIIRKTEEEKIAAKRVYRRKYAHKESTRAKMLEKAKNPDRIAKRKAYAAKPEVKKRKQELAALNRSVRRKMKEELPHMYNKLVEDIIAQKEEQENSEE